MSLGEVGPDSDGLAVGGEGLVKLPLGHQGLAEVGMGIGDPAAPLGRDKLGTYRPLYNVQTMSDLGTDRVRASATIPTTTDSGQLVPLIDQTHQVTQRRLNEVLVDAGYPSGPELAQCVQRGVTVLAPWNEKRWDGGQACSGRSRRSDSEGPIHV